MKIPANEMPAKMAGDCTTVWALENWGGLSSAYFELPAGTDLSPMLEGLPQNACASHHWGYVLKGRMTVRNADRSQDELEAGDVFHILPGHTATVQEAVAWIEFSPDNEFKQTLEHVLQKQLDASRNQDRDAPYSCRPD